MLANDGVGVGQDLMRDGVQALLAHVTGSEEEKSRLDRWRLQEAKWNFALGCRCTIRVVAVYLYLPTT